MGISKKELKDMNAYFRALNYISVGQLYLLDNPLLKEELKWSHVKKKIVGHWGTVPGQNFIYTHLNRIIKKNDLNMIYISGPGHGGNAVVSNVYLEGTYTEIYPEITEDTDGLRKLFKQFSFPGGIASHAAPETPGSINEGGELGYSLSHAFGAVFDNPDLIAACVIGDGEAETGPLATSWHSNKFLNPKRDGIVLPILHLNGYKISNPTVLSRISNEELSSLLYGYGWKPYLVEGSTTMELHKNMALTLDRIIKEKTGRERSAMKKKLILAGTVLMGAGLALAGCGDSSKTSDGKTKIEMVQYKPEADKAFEKMEEKFNETHDDIELTIESPNEAMTILKTRFIKEDQPDIIRDVLDIGDARAEDIIMLFHIVIIFF